MAAKAELLSQEISQLRKRKADTESNIANCDNAMLSQRFKANLAQLERELRMKEEDFEGLSMFT